MADLSRSFYYRRLLHGLALQPPNDKSIGFGLFRFRSPLLTESILFLFLRLLRCFTSAGIACFFLTSPLFSATNRLRGFGKRRWRINTTRLPHSEISGSKPICGSPKLIAAYHVLHRLLAPRHPLCALQSLIPCFETSFESGASRPPFRSERFRRTVPLP